MRAIAAPHGLPLASLSLALFASAAMAASCSTSPAAPGAGAGGAPTTTTTTSEVDAGDDDAAPGWLGDAGLVVREPVKRPLRELCGIASNPGEMPLGSDPTSAARRKGYFDAAIDLGGVMIRRDIRFADVEPERGTFVFDAYDELVAEAKGRGVRLLATLGYGTLWAHPGAVDEFYPPDDPKDFADYAGKVAARYQGELAGYEIWNEPNGGFRFWKGTTSGDPKAYAALLAAAAPAIRAADPKTPVLLGGTVFTPQLIEGAMQWLGEAYAARPDLAKSFDVAGVHTYQAYPPRTAPELGDAIDAPLEDKLGMHAWLLAQHGAGDDPIWITEIGWPVTNDVDAATQARFTVRATILAARAGASGIFWYTLRDGVNHDPGAFPPEGSFGLLEYDADPTAGKPKPKPVYVALRALLATVGARWPAAEIDAPVGARAIRFEGAAGLAPVLAAWAFDAKSASLAAPFAGTVVAQDGKAGRVVKAGEALSLGGDVIYLVAQ
jgi:hypothetical protein